MKFNKIAVFIAALLVSVSAFAQPGLDYFGGARTIFTPPKSITATDSNSIVDLHGWEGIIKADLMCCTNSGASITSVQLMTSADKTNWVALANYALGTSNSIVTTNFYYGSGTPLATNFYQFAGTVITPTASSSGFATPYILPAPFTNSGSQTINNGLVEMGFNAQSASRYVQVVWTLASVTTATNSVCAIFTGRKQQQ